MKSSFGHILVLLVMVPETLAVVAGIIRFRRLSPPLRYYLVPLIIFGFLTDLISRIITYQKIMSNHFLIYLYIPVEFALLAMIYRYEFKQHLVAKVIPFLIAGLAGFELYEILVERKQGFSPETRFIEGLLIIFFVLFYLYKTIKKLEITHLENEPMFWLSSGLFIYFSCDIIIFTFSNLVLSSYSKQFNLQLWNVHAILTMLLYLFYTLTLWISPRK